MAGLRTDGVKEAYMRVFSTEDGRIILADLLSLLGYFSNQTEAIKPECIKVANTILSRCGVLDSSGVGVFMEGIGYSIGIAQAESIARGDKEDNDDI